MELLQMNDTIAPLIVMLESVTGITSTDSILVDWYNSFGQNFLYSVDRVRKTD